MSKGGWRVELTWKMGGLWSWFRGRLAGFMNMER